MAKKQYKLVIEPITAVHIGTGEELTPLDYKVVTTNLGNRCYCKYSSDKILSRLVGSGDKQALIEFERASVAGNMKELQTFFNKKFKQDDIDYMCNTTNEFVSIYNRNKDKDPYEAASLVLQMYRPEGLKTPVIPGSSLKGAIRTAVVNELIYDFSEEKYNSMLNTFDSLRERKKREFEKKLQKASLNNYSDAKNDPFRCIEISDCSFKLKNSQIVGILKNIKIDKYTNHLTALDKMMIQAEAITGSLMNVQNNGEAIIRVNTDLQKEKQVTKNISITDIISSCNDFYLTQFENEYEKFYEDSTDSECDSIVKLYSEIKKISKMENSFILRVGRWSQIEYVTFEENLRSPETRVINGKQLPYGTTRTVFNYDGQYLPMGWCKCTITEIKV